MTTLSAYFKDYASYHRTPGNQFCHYFGIPMITIAVLGLLGTLSIAGGLTSSEFIRLDAGSLVWLIGFVFYLFLDWKLALPFGLFSAGLYFFGRALPIPVLWGLFIVGWIIQYVGHYVYEKRSPAFYRNVTHFLIGPLWIFAKLVRYT